MKILAKKPKIVILISRIYLKVTKKCILLLLVLFEAVSHVVSLIESSFENSQQ